MNRETEGSLAAQIFCLLLFGGSSIIAIAVFFIELVDITRSLLLMSGTVTLNKGFLYLLGLGILSGTLTMALVLFTILNKSMSGFLKQITNAGFITGLFSLFVVPHAVHFTANHYLTKHGYSICVDQSYTWFFYKNLVYKSQGEDCL